MSSKLYTIPAYADDIDILAKRLISESSGNALGLSEMAVVLPDRDAVDRLKEALIAHNDGKPMILPQIVTVDGLDDDVLSLRLAGSEGFTQDVMALPPSIDNLSRQMILAREIIKHPNTANSMEAALSLAKDMGRFIDELHENNVDVSRLADIKDNDIPGDAEKTRALLNIVALDWPRIKSEMGVTDRTERRQKTLGLLAEYLEQQGLKMPVVMAGFRSYSHGLTRFVKALNDNADNARIVLPGLEISMGQDSWDAVDESHPQFAFKDLLNSIELKKEDVSYWPGTTGSSQSRSVVERRKLLREAMRPSETTHKWKHLKVFDKAKLRPSKRIVPKGSPLSATEQAGPREIDPISLTGLETLVAGTPQEEASAIALKLREVLEAPEKTALFVTSDEGLARRVISRLDRWNIKGEFEGGQTLYNSKSGEYARSALQMALQELAPIPLLNVLKNPATTLGDEHGSVLRQTEALEDIALHGVRPPPGFEGLKKHVRFAFNEKARRIKTKKKRLEVEAEVSEVEAWIDGVKARLSTAVDILTVENPMPLEAHVIAHIKLLEGLTETSLDDKKTYFSIWQGREGAALARTFKALMASDTLKTEMTGAEYAALFDEALKSRRVKVDTHPRLRIVNPRDAHLFAADTTIFGGLTANNSPGKQSEKFWLSAHIRKLLDLPPLDVDLGQEAYSFVAATSNKNVLLTRAERDQNAPTVSSPYLTRLMMLLRGLGLEDKVTPRSKLLDMNAALHRPNSFQPLDVPRPTPPASSRPRRLSVSAIETLLRDPYTVYARYILKLYPKNGIDAEPAYNDRGTMIHDALEEFKKRTKDGLPDNAYDVLIECGEDAFASRMDNPFVRAFWWPRFERMAKWVIDYERMREELSNTIGMEIPGRLDVETEEGRFVITAIADRIDELLDGTVSIIDYKTGGVPTKKDVAQGLSPQLTLEALMALSGGFKGVEAKDVGMLEYWRLSGGRPAGDITQIENIDKLHVETLEGLTRILAHYAKKDTPYLPTPRPKIAPKYVPYNHLGRSDEWGQDVSKGKSGGRGRPKLGGGM